MNPTAYELAFIAGGFGIIGALLGVLATYWLSRKLVRETHKNAIELLHISDFNKAATEFHCTFLESLQQLRDDPKADWFNILNPNALLEHEKAAMRFGLFLSDEERSRFDLDWNVYFSHRPHPGNRYKPKKQPEEWKDEDNCKVFIEQIERLLSYAKLK